MGFLPATAQSSRIVGEYLFGLYFGPAANASVFPVSFVGWKPAFEYAHPKKQQPMFLGEAWVGRKIPHPSKQGGRCLFDQAQDKGIVIEFSLGCLDGAHYHQHKSRYSECKQQKDPDDHEHQHSSDY